MESGQADGARLLVMGYRATLRSSGSENLPPPMETLLEPWLEQANHSLNQRVPPPQRLFQGEAVPLDSLLPLLKDRLIGILTQAVGAIGIAPGELSVSYITREVPLLSPLLHRAVAEWVAAIGTFLQRLHRDQSWLAASLECQSLPPIQSIFATASDVHAGGHPVLRVCFLEGGCLYYKPRPLTGEWLWHELLAAIGDLDPRFQLPSARVFTRDASSRYGWVDSVLPAERQLSDASDRRPPAALDYWHSAGATLGLAQHARLTDLHLGNIIATPSGPAVADAECFAAPMMMRQPRAPKDPRHQAPLSDAVEAILRTGLLPRGQDFHLPDASGLFGHAAPVSGIRLPAWSLSSDGRYQLVFVSAELIDHGNAPSQTTPLVVLPQMVSGYRHAAELLIRARKTLLAPGSQWRAVLEKWHAPRMVLRDTLAYGCLLSRSLEPQNLRSFYQRRNAVLSQLQSHVGQNLPPAVQRAELNSILQLYVPRFSILPGSRTLATGSGRAISRRFTTATPAHSVFESMETLCYENIEKVHIPALLAAVL